MTAPMSVIAGERNAREDRPAEVAAGLLEPEGDLAESFQVFVPCEQAEAGQHGEQERNDEPPGDRGRRRRHAFFVFAAGREPEREAGAGEGDVDEPGDQPGQPPAEDGRPTGCDSGGEEGQADGDADEQGKVQQPI